ncbi:MAG: alpha/beta hydrolase [Thermoanaerobaculia bacterium]
MSGKPEPVLLSIPVPLRLFSAPPAEPGPGKSPVLVITHGYAMDALPMLGLAKRFAPPSFRIVSIRGPQSTYAIGASSGETRSGFHFGVSPDADDNRAVHRAAVEAAVAWADANGADGSRVSLAGFSHSCSFNYRLALDPPHGVPFRAVVGLCGGVPGEWKGPGVPGTQTSNATPVLHVSTNEDEWYPPEKVAPYKSRLEARFASAEHLRFEGGHRVPSAAFGAIREFLAAHG